MFFETRNSELRESFLVSVVLPCVMKLFTYFSRVQCSPGSHAYCLVTMRISPVHSHGFTGHVQKCTGQHTQSSQCDIAIVLCPVQCMRKESSFRQGRLPTASEHKVEAKKLLELPPWLESPRVLRATISGHMRVEAQYSKTCN